MASWCPRNASPSASCVYDLTGPLVIVMLSPHRLLTWSSGLWGGSPAVHRGHRWCPRAARGPRPTLLPVPTPHSALPAPWLRRPGPPTSAAPSDPLPASPLLLPSFPMRGPSPASTAVCSGPCSAFRGPSRLACGLWPVACGLWRFHRSEHLSSHSLPLSSRPPWLSGTDF